MDSYLPMFLAEGRAHLQELDLAVVRIEETPDDQDTVDEIFRIAHSMKGMSATMGFAGTAAPTHEMEDVFELLRQRRGGLERAAIDVRSDSLDALSAAVEAIDATGQEQTNPEPLIARLQSLVGERTPVQEAQRAGTEFDTFAGREVEARVVCEHTDEALSDAASGVPEVAEVLVPDAAVEEGEPERVVTARRPHAKSSSTVRVDAERLDQLMHYTGELVLHRTQVEALAAGVDVPGLSQAMQSLTRSSDERPFAIPLDRIERTVRVADQTVRSVAGRRMLVLGDGVLPIVDASERYGGPPSEAADCAVVVRGGSDRFAVLVSRLIGQHELVTRPLPPEVADGGALSGAAVLSDGQIALIVDCDAVVDVPVTA